MEMGYLIIAEGERVVATERHALQDPEYSTVCALIEKTYPECRVFTPLERCSSSAIILTVYTSCSKDGAGRCGSCVDMWAVDTILTAEV